MLQTKSLQILLCSKRGLPTVRPISQLARNVRFSTNTRHTASSRNQCAIISTVGGIFIYNSFFSNDSVAHAAQPRTVVHESLFEPLTQTDVAPVAPPEDLDQSAEQTNEQVEQQDQQESHAPSHKVARESLLEPFTQTEISPVAPPVELDQAQVAQEHAAKVVSQEKTKDESKPPIWSFQSSLIPQVKHAFEPVESTLDKKSEKAATEPDFELNPGKETRKSSNH